MYVSEDFRDRIFQMRQRRVFRQLEDLLQSSSQLTGIRINYKVVPRKQPNPTT